MHKLCNLKHPGSRVRVLSRRRDHPTHHETELALFFTRHHSSVPCLGHSSSRARAHSAAQFRGDRRPWSRDFRPCAKRALCGSSNVNQEFPEGKVGKTHLVLVSEAVQGVEYAHLVSTALPFAVIADDFRPTGSLESGYGKRHPRGQWRLHDRCGLRDRRERILHPRDPQRRSLSAQGPPQRPFSLQRYGSSRDRNRDAFKTVFGVKESIWDHATDSEDRKDRETARHLLVGSTPPEPAHGQDSCPEENGRVSHPSHTSCVCAELVVLLSPGFVHGQIEAS